MTTSTSNNLLSPPVSTQALSELTQEQWRAALRAEPREAAAWVSAAAQAGHADAQAVLGQWLLDGRGIARDPVQGLHWFLCAAQRDHAMAMNMAGRCHEQGWGTEVDLDKAAHWYRRAAAAALPEARYNLANLLASANTGSSRKARDAHEAALSLYQQAADQGYAKAFAKLGRYYEDGLIVDRDADMAMRCYRRGAEGGDFRAQFNYAGTLAAQGRTAEALDWLGKVPATATAKYLRSAGAVLLESPHLQIRRIGQEWLAAAQASASDSQLAGVRP